MKKILPSIVALFLFGSSIFLFAQEIGVLSKKSLSKAYTSFSVTDFDTKKTTYDTGEELTGLFRITNNSSQEINLNYTLFLAGDYGENTLANAFYGGTEYVAVSDLKPQESRIIHFTYTLPAGIGGENMGLQLQFYSQSGEPLRWFDSPRFKVINGLTQLSLSDFFILSEIAGKKTRAPATVGPAMYESKEPEELQGSFTYKGVDKDLVIHPEIFVYDTVDNEKLVYNEKLPSFIARASLSGTYEFSLPKIGRPSVYLAKIVLMDAEKNYRSKEIYYRYTVDGNIIRIRDVSLSNYAPKIGESVTLSFDYMGTPFDPILSQDKSYIQPSQKNTAKLTILNPAGEKVSLAEKEFLSPDDLSINFDVPVVAIHPSWEIRLEVVDKQGDTVASFSRNIYFQRNTSYAFFTTSFWSSIAACLIIIVGGMYSLKKRSKRILYVIILLVALLSVYTFYAHAENNTTVASREVGGMTLSATGARYQPYSFVSDWFTPQPGVAWPSGGACRYVLNGLIVSGNQEFYRTYGPENTFYVTGTINYSQCGNSLMNIKLTVTNTPGTTSWQTLSASTGVTSGAGAKMYQYAVGPFTTPSQPGDYTYALDGVIDNGNCHANFHLNMPYRVSSPDLCTNNTPPSTPEVVVNTSSLLVGQEAHISFISHDQQNNIISYQVDWGDGILKTEESPTVRSWDTPGVKTFRVRAIDDCGESPWVTLTINVLDKPTLSNITLTSTRACSEVALSWNNNGAEMYQVFRKQGAGTYVVVASPNTGTTFTDTNVIEGQSYTYKIVSYLGLNEKTSNEVTFSPSACPCIYPQVRNTADGICHDPLQAVCVPSSFVTGVNQNIIWTATAVGGTGTYSYVWSGAVTGGVNPVTTSFTTLGTKVASLKVKSGSQTLTTTCSLLVSSDVCKNFDGQQGIVPTGFVTDKDENCVCPRYYTLTITKTGNGTGTVTSTPTGIDCGTTCSKLFPSGTPLTLKAVPNTGSIFTGWTGDADCMDGLVSLNSNIACIAHFEHPEKPLAPTNFSATPSTCGNNWLTLSWNTTEKATGYRVYRGNTIVYDGVATNFVDRNLTLGSSYTYFLEAYNDIGVSARVSVLGQVSSFCNYTLTITKTGNGTGTVTSTPTGIDCGTTCSKLFPSGTPLTLTPTPDTDSVFTAWSGNSDCDDAHVTMNSDKTCIALFDLKVPRTKPNLTVRPYSTSAFSVSGNGKTYQFQSIIQNFSVDTGTGFNNIFQIATDTSGNNSHFIEKNLPALGANTEGIISSGDYIFSSNGTYYMRACADQNTNRIGVIDESNENDNCGEWVQVTVSGGGGDTDIDAVCGSANKIYGTSDGDYGMDVFCQKGNLDGNQPLFPTVGTSVTWKCLGIGTGASVECTARQVSNRIDGACGTANGTSMPTLPISGLCNTGNMSPITGSGPWYWTCEGINGGISSPQCSALKFGGGPGASCGSAAKNYPPSDMNFGPNPQFCTSGNSNPTSPVFPTNLGDSVNWECGGVTCTAHRTNPATASLNGCFADGTTMNPIPTLDTYVSLLNQRIAGGQFGYLLSDSNRILQNQTFWTRLNQNINTFIKNQYSPKIFSWVSPAPDFINFNNLSDAAVMKGSLDGNPYGYYYYQGLNGGRLIIDTAKITGPKVILAEGIDVHIKTNVAYDTSDSTSSLVIIVRKGTGGQGGNILIFPDVTRIDATMIAEGALKNADNDGNILDWVTHSNQLNNKLVINGRLLTRNTRGGSLDASLQAVASGYCGDNSTTKSCVDASEQDLERFRLTTTPPGTGEPCTLYVTGVHPMVVPVLMGIID